MIIIAIVIVIKRAGTDRGLVRCMLCTRYFPEGFTVINSLQQHFERLPFFPRCYHSNFHLMDDQSEARKSQMLCSVSLSSKWWSHDSDPRKSGFRVCNQLPSNNLLLDGKAENVPEHINDHISHFVLDTELVLCMVDDSEVRGWQRVLWVAVCSLYRTSRIQTSNSNLHKQKEFTGDITEKPSSSWGVAGSQNAKDVIQSIFPSSS